MVNSGCANACTGADGMAHANAMADLAAAALSCAPAEVLVASTGVIGVKLDMAKVERGIGLAASGAVAVGWRGRRARHHDDRPVSQGDGNRNRQRRQGTFRVGGIAKGSGMIEPMMATMLGFVTTDAAVEPGLLQRALRAAVEDTFNAITVDGECSTNDCVFALASGASGVALGDEPTCRCWSTRSRLPASRSRSASCAAARARPS